MKRHGHRNLNTLCTGSLQRPLRPKVFRVHERHSKLPRDIQRLTLTVFVAYVIYREAEEGSLVTKAVSFDSLSWCKLPPVQFEYSLSTAWVWHIWLRPRRDCHLNRSNRSHVTNHRLQGSQGPKAPSPTQVLRVGVHGAVKGTPGHKAAHAHWIPKQLNSYCTEIIQAAQATCFPNFTCFILFGYCGTHHMHLRSKQETTVLKYLEVRISRN